MVAKLMFTNNFIKKIEHYLHVLGLLFQEKNNSIIISWPRFVRLVDAKFVVGGMGIKDTKGEQSVEGPCECGVDALDEINGVQSWEVGVKHIIYGTKC